MTQDTCRHPTCENDPKGGGGFAGKFCSDECEVRFEHIRQDAKEARLDDQREQHHDDAPRHGGDTI